MRIQNMGESAEKYVQLYRRMAAKSRRPYFLQLISLDKRENHFSFKKSLGYLLNDVRYFSLWSLNIFLVTKAYGVIIKNEYGTSYVQQMWRMFYILFAEQLSPKSFRSHLLFKDENWKKVSDYIYEHYDPQIALALKFSAAEVEIIKNKYAYFRFCKKHNIATPQVIAVFENGVRTDHKNRDLQIPSCNLFIKYLYGKAGQGVKKLTYYNGNYRDSEGKIFTSRQVYEYLINESKKKEGVILQEVVENHISWKPFTSGALCTCRFVTAKSPEDNSIIPLFCALRMPVGKTDCDNYTQGGLFVSVDIETGEMGTGVGVKPQKGKFEFDTHPDTGVPFKGMELPYWRDIVDFTIKVHQKFDTKILGWDVTLTPDGCNMIETNIGWTAESVESTTQLPLTETIYPEIYGKWMEKN